MIEKLLNEIFKFLENEGFQKLKPAGVLSERMAYGKFNPSAGHHIVDPIIQDKVPYEIKKFSLIERCIREADISRIGLSNRHLTFFEMLAFHIYGEYTKLPKEEITEKFYSILVDILKLEKERLLVTILGEYKIENLSLNKSETEEIYNTWVKLLGEKQVIRTRGRRNFFIAKIPGAAGGTGFEVYYKMNNGNYIEIGSQVAYHFVYDGPNNIHKKINGTLGSGIGIERVLMVLEEKNTIYDISLFIPLKEVLIKKLESGLEKLYEENVNIIVDQIRAISFIFYDKEKSGKQLTDSQSRLLKKFKKKFEGEIIYLGLNYEIYNELVEKQIELYKKRFPEFENVKDKILSFFREK